MDPPFDASIITDLLLHVIGTNLAIYYAILLAFCLHLENSAEIIQTFTLTGMSNVIRKLIMNLN